jgi:predicted GIY-YIG superfamily endonuclease
VSIVIALFIIYQIVDPSDGLPFYVGFTANIEERIKQHLSGDNSNPAKRDRIAEIQARGLTPQFEELDRIEGTVIDARQREMYWIRYQRRAGAHLLNTGVPLEEYTKYTTHLDATTIKAVKLYAIIHKMKDYEVVQQALDLFLSRDESVS